MVSWSGCSNTRTGPSQVSKAMRNNASGTENGIDVDEKRARYEAFEFAVCRDGEHVNVSYGKEERGANIYSVTVKDGEPVECSCPHHQHRGVRCKHIHAVASNEVVQRAIKAAQAELLPDGGVSPGNV